MKASKILLTLIAVYFLVQSEGDEDSLKIHSVGYQSTENISLPIFCFLKVSKSESKGIYPFFLKGVLGIYYDGHTLPYINGTLNPEGGDLCYTPGIVKSVIWKSVPQDVWLCTSYARLRNAG
ncbi:hypothetical protein G9C98_002999 [Cotesia typhae]|uniref:Uncharacterized protein n=1 Tax=Cotesia typhae TaxID=2053667 RepID=A0A8J5R1K4_9HYME|nr:hypothetical protein G9C98_002999 [Cotesia typhae]